MTVLEWLEARIPSFAYEEIDPEYFLKEEGLGVTEEFTSSNKTKVYSAYAHVLKKMLLAFNNISEEGISISLDTDFIKQELKVYGKYVTDEENFLGLPDITNAGEWL